MISKNNLQISVDNIKIYIINLEKRTDRKKHMINLLNKIGFKNYQFFVPLKVNKDTLKLLPNNLNINNASESSLSLFLTHIFIINNTKDNCFFIMEDDIINNFETTEILNKIDYIIKNVPKNTDMIRLEMCGETCSKIKKYKNNIYKLYGPYCTACILFFKNSKKKLIKYFNDLNYYNYSLLSKISKNTITIDDFYRKLNVTKKLNSYGYFPPLFKQLTNFGSNIKGSRRSIRIFSNYEDKVCKESYYKIILIIGFLLTCLIFYYIHKNKSINLLK